MSKNILVVGGAGYIGSHMVKRLLRAGYTPIVLDDLSQGHRDAVKNAQLVVGELGDANTLDTLFQAFPISAVMHFASFIQVGESVDRPGKYYDNNLGNTLALLEAMVRHGIKKFIFSSTAAIFGDPRYVPIDERHPRAPINPYGRSKWMVEEMLRDFDLAYGMKACCLRYFNAAGADPEGELGERHLPETHLIPLVLQVAAGRRAHITVYGDDYDTPDGTCIRDYVHVQDLCDAHLLALEALMGGGASAQYNLGNGAGFSILEVIAAARRVTGRDIAALQGPRRAGDPARLVADPALARCELGWRPAWSSLDAIIEHAWRWECQQQAGQAASPAAAGSAFTATPVATLQAAQQAAERAGERRRAQERRRALRSFARTSRPAQ